MTISARGTIGYTQLRLESYIPIVRLLSVTPRTSDTSVEFLFCYLKSSTIEGFGTTQQQMTVPVIKKKRLLIPDLQTMIDFTSVVRSIFTIINSYENESKGLNEVRDSLLLPLISGEIAVFD